MKKWIIMLMVGCGLTAFSGLSVAADMDQRSMADEGMMMEEAADDAGQAQDMAQGAMEEEETEAPEEKSWGVANSARALIKGTEEGSEISGRVDFIQTGDGVQVVASLSHISPTGKHGIHIHAEGSCDDGGKAAGGHFNPAGTQHGLLPRDGDTKAHAGDMGNIDIDDKGNGALIVFMPGLSLTKGDTNIAGKAVILHEKEDDFGQPTGNAGGRIGCGIIVLNH